jgi:hypothetical protein
LQEEEVLCLQHNSNCVMVFSNDVQAAIYGSGKIYYSGRPVIDVTSSGSGRLVHQ